MVEVAHGSDIAFAELIHRHQGKLVNFFVRMGVAPDVGEDLAQETFLKLYRMRMRYHVRARFTTFLFGMARNIMIDHARHRQRQRDLMNSYAQTLEIAADGHAAQSTELGMDTSTILARLSPKLREVIVLNVVQGLKYEEVAAALRIPEGTVKSRMNLAMIELRKIRNELR